MRTIPMDIKVLADDSGGIFLNNTKDVPSLGAYALILRVNKNLKITTGIHGEVSVPRMVSLCRQSPPGARQKA